MKFSVIALVLYTVSCIVMVSAMKIAQLKNRGKILKVSRNVWNLKYLENCYYFATQNFDLE